MKLKDFFNKKVNKRNFQISLDLKKRKAKEEGIDLDELLEQEITEKVFKKFKKEKLI